MDDLTPTPRFLRRFGLPLAAGVIGLAGMAIRLPEQIAASRLPPNLAAMPLGMVVLLSLLTPFVLLLVASLAGALTAHRAGLRSALAGTRGWPSPREWLLGIGAGLLAAAVIAGVDAYWSTRALLAWPTAAGPHAADPRQLMLGVLYGGLSEEVLMRWGLVSFFAWALYRTIARSKPQAPGWVLALAVLLASVLFGLAHIPAVSGLAVPTPELLARTVAINAGVGLLYGWMYVKRGLEVAIAAHAATHLGFFLVALVVRLPT